MKLFFLKNDSLYKIFTTLEKIPRKSDVDIFIESDNQFFNNGWRFKQIDGIIQKKEINALFIAENKTQQHFFEEHQIPYTIKKQSKIRELINLLYRFFFNIKKFHLHTYEKKNYTFFAIFGSEILLLFVLGYLFYSLILPQTTITITPSYQINEIVYNFRYMYPENIKDYPFTGKHIILPLQIGSLPHATVSADLNKKNVPQTATLLKGKIRIINTSKTVFNLQTNTQLIDDQGIEFTTIGKVILPKSHGEQQAGIAYVDIIAKDNPTNNNLIKQYGDNLTIGHQLLVKKLKQSTYTKQVYAEIIEGFREKTIQHTGTILFSEIGDLQKQLYFKIFDTRKQFITKTVVPDDGIFIPFNKFITVTGCQYNARGDNNNIQALKILSGSLSCMIDFAYVNKKDFIDGVQEYIQKRSTDSRKVINIQNNSVTFFQAITGEYNSTIIPTRINIVESYNMATDRNNIIPTIKSQIVGLDKANAQKVINSYPEIEKAEIKISPRWYSTITNIKSRIVIKIKEQDNITTF